MAFSIRSFFGKDKSPENTAGANGMMGKGANASPAGHPNGSSPAPLQQNPFATNMIFKTANAAEVPGQPVGSPFSPAPSGAPGLTVSDILSQLPPDVARNGNLPPSTPLILPDEVIDRAVRTGQGSLSLFEIYRVCPALFQTPISPHDPRQVSLPPHKIAQLLPGMKPGAPSQPSPDTSAPASPFSFTQPSIPQNPAPQPSQPPMGTGGGSPFSFAPPTEAPAPAPAEPPAAIPQPPVSPFSAAASITAAGPFSQSASPFAPAGGNPFASPPPPAEAPPAGQPFNPGANPFFPSPPPTSTGNPFASSSSPFSAAPPEPSQPEASASHSPFMPKPPESPFGTAQPASSPATSPFSFGKPPESPFAAAQPGPPPTVNPFEGAASPPPASPMASPFAAEQPGSPPMGSPFAPAPQPASPVASPFAAVPPVPQPPASLFPVIPISDPAPTPAPANSPGASPFAAVPVELPAGGPPASPFSFGVPTPPPLQEPAPQSAPVSPFAEASPPPSPAAPNPFARIQALGKPPEAPPAEVPSSLPPSPFGGHPFAQSFEKPSFPSASSEPEGSREPITLPPHRSPFEPRSPFESAEATSFPAPKLSEVPAAPSFEPAPAAAFTPPAPVIPPASVEMMRISLAAALKQCPEHDLGVDPRQIPAWVQVALPIETIRVQLAAGKVVLPMSQIIAGLEPEYRNLIDVRPDLMVQLPTNELFHALPKINPQPPAPAVAPEPPESVAVVVEREPEPAAAPEEEPDYDPFAGLPSFPDWKGAPVPAAELPPAHSSDLPTASAFPTFPEPEGPASDFPPPHNWSFGSQKAPESTSLPFPPKRELPAPAELPKEGDSSLDDDYTPPSLFHEIEEDEAPAASPAPDGDSALADFLSKLPVPASEAPKVPAPAPSEALSVSPASLLPVATQPPGSHRQLLLRVLFGVQEDLNADSVVRYTAMQPGVSSVVCIRDGQVHAVSGNGSPEAEQFSRHASRIHQHLMPLIELTGITDAETFSINSEHDILTFSKQDGMTLAVLHSREEAALKEKITLVARELAGLLRDDVRHI